MKKILLINFLLIVFTGFVFGQSSDFQKVKSLFESFEHDKVISYSNELLKNNLLPDSLSVDIYLMRAISFYALNDESNSKNSFVEILKIKKDFEPDPSIVSPKLITIFNDVKNEFIKKENSLSGVDSLAAVSQSKIVNGDLLKESAIKNILLPGWGQINSGNTVKGIIFSVLSTAALSSMVYYISDTNKKENDYLNSYLENSFQEKYNAYNSSYKIRNTLIISYAAIWIFSQLDLFLFSDNDTANNPKGQLFGINQSTHNSFDIKIKIPF